MDELVEAIEQAYIEAAAVEASGGWFDPYRHLTGKERDSEPGPRFYYHDVEYFADNTNAWDV